MRNVRTSLFSSSLSAEVFASQQPLRLCRILFRIFKMPAGCEAARCSSIGPMWECSAWHRLVAAPITVLLLPWTVLLLQEEPRRCQSRGSAFFSTSCGLRGYSSLTSSKNRQIRVYKICKERTFVEESYKEKKKTEWLKKEKIYTVYTKLLEIQTSTPLRYHGEILRELYINEL